jgi:hypothetical protein
VRLEIGQTSKALAGQQFVISEVAYLANASPSC